MHFLSTGESRSLIFSLTVVKESKLLAFGHISLHIRCRTKFRKIVSRLDNTPAFVEIWTEDLDRNDAPQQIAVMQLQLIDL